MMMKQMNKQVQKGFTLIELMIVVAIIGILAAIAIPAYQDYTKRAQATELMTAMSPVKVAVSEYAITYDQLPGQNSINFTASTSTHVQSVIWTGGANGVIRATAPASPASPLDGMVIELDPTFAAGDNQVVWDCNTTTNPQWAPSSCQ